MKLFRAIACLAAIVAALGLVACGGDDETTTAADTAAETTETPSGDTGATGAEEGATGATGDAGDSGEATTLQIAADPSGALEYTKTDLTAPAGNVTVEFTNESPIPHDVVFSEPGGEAGGEQIGGTDVVSEGSASTELTDLEPAKYQFWCTVPGHLEAGMKGTLTVK